MIKFSVRNFCNWYIYVYLLVYQLVVVFFRSSQHKASGAMWQIQAYQCSVFLVLIFYHYLNRDKTRKVVNIWIWLCIIYLFLFLLHICAYVDPVDFMIETSTFFRILMWLYFGYVMTQVREDPVFMKRFMICFFIGTTLLAIEALTYSSLGIAERDVYKNAGDALGGSTVSEGGFNKGTILCVALNIVLGFYWIISGKAKSIKYGQLFCLISIAICSFGIIKSYQRAIQLAIFVGFVYSLYWSAVRTRIVLFLSLICVLFAVSSIMLFSENNYLARWENVSSDEGSGRRTFYSYAIEMYTDRMPFDQKIVGAGYAALVRTTGLFMHSRSMYGIHTHSDFFDMLVCYGAVGVVLFFSVICAFSQFLRKVPKRTYESLVMRVSLMICITSFFTTGVFSAVYSLVGFIMLQNYCIMCSNEKLRGDLLA